MEANHTRRRWIMVSLSLARRTIEDWHDSLQQNALAFKNEAFYLRGYQSSRVISRVRGTPSSQVDSCYRGLWQQTVILDYSNQQHQEPKIGKYLVSFLHEQSHSYSPIQRIGYREDMKNMACCSATQKSGRCKLPSTNFEELSLI